MPFTRPHRRGFFILFGTRSLISNDARAPVQTICPSCRQSVQIIAKTYRQWFTLFFCPIFPISGRTHFSECANCRAQFRLDIDELRHRLSTPDPRLYQNAIGLYNTLRQSPRDSALLNQVLEAYAQIGDYNEALAAGRHFPDALNESAQCLTTYAKIHLAAGNAADAINYLQQAIAKNPSLAEAHYFLAIAHLSSTPPNQQAAQSSARAAQSLGHPDAPALLQRAAQPT
jgi:tetratricopeptide (TPR) repeat protein